MGFHTAFGTAHALRSERCAHTVPAAQHKGLALPCGEAFNSLGKSFYLLLAHKHLIGCLRVVTFGAVNKITTFIIRP